MLCYVYTLLCFLALALKAGVILQIISSPTRQSVCQIRKCIHLVGITAERTQDLDGQGPGQWIQKLGAEFSRPSETSGV